jgi:hypothetical protein
LRAKVFIVLECEQKFNWSRLQYRRRNTERKAAWRTQELLSLRAHQRLEGRAARDRHAQKHVRHLANLFPRGLKKQCGSAHYTGKPAHLHVNEIRKYFNPLALDAGKESLSH